MNDEIRIAANWNEQKITLCKNTMELLLCSSSFHRGLEGDNGFTNGTAAAVVLNEYPSRVATKIKHKRESKVILVLSSR